MLVFDVRSYTAHSNIKLFMYRGGSQSTQEAIHHAIPVLGIPNIIRSGVSIEETKISRCWESFESRRPDDRHAEIYYSGNYT